MIKPPRKTTSILIGATLFVVLSLLGKCIDADAKELELPSQRLGPQFLFLWGEDQLFAAVQALETMSTKNYDGVLAGNAEAQERYQKMIDKLYHSPTIVWVTRRETGETVFTTLRRIQFTMGQEIFMHFSASRYHCRQTYNGFTLHWKSNWHRVHSGFRLPDEQWGEDDNLDANENPVKMGPALCDYYNQRAEALDVEVKEHKMRSFGGYPIVALPWAMLDWAIEEVTNPRSSWEVGATRW